MRTTFSHSPCIVIGAAFALFTAGCNTTTTAPVAPPAAVETTAVTAAQQRHLTELNTQIEEGLSVSGVRLAKTLGTSARTAERFGDTSHELVDLELAPISDPVMLIGGTSERDLATRRFTFANPAARDLLRLSGPEGQLLTAVRHPAVLKVADEALFAGREGADDRLAAARLHGEHARALGVDPAQAFHLVEDRKSVV